MRTIICACTLAVGAASIVFSRRLLSSGGTALGSASLFIEPIQLDFGEVWAQPNFSTVLSVHNVSSTAVNVERFAAGCACTSITPVAVTIPAGEVRDVRAIIDLSTQTKCGLSSGACDSAITISAICKGMLVPTAWRLHGKVRVPYELAPRVLDFGELGDGSAESSFSGAVEAICATGVRIVSATCQTSWASAVVEARSQDDDPTCRLVVSLAQNEMHSGSFNFSVEVEAATADGERFLGPPLLVRGFLTPDLELIPSEAHFPVAAVGEVLELEMILRSRALRPLQIEPASDSALGFEIVELPSKVAEVKSFIVRQQVLATGPQSNHIQIVVNTGQETKELPVVITYYGREPHP